MSLIKATQFMLYRTKVVVSIEINTAHINTVWVECTAVRLIRKIAKSNYQLRHVCRPSLCVEQLDSYWTDIHKISYLNIFRKYFEKIKFSLKSDKNSRKFTWRPIYVFDHISVNSS